MLHGAATVERADHALHKIDSLRLLSTPSKRHPTMLVGLDAVQNQP